jgi:hypothetical protein
LMRGVLCVRLAGDLGQREGNAMEDALSALVKAGAFLLLCLGKSAIYYGRKVQ